MPEETLAGLSVKSTLESLEYYNLNNHLSRTRDYNIILNALENDSNISVKEIERLLVICVHDLREYMQFAATIMNIILKILSGVKEGIYEPCPELLPSALAVIHTMKATAPLNKADTLKALSYGTLLSYPDTILIAVAVEHPEEIMELFNLYCYTKTPSQIRLQACSLLSRILKILPSEEKRTFVEIGLGVWFSKIIPSLITLCDNEIIMELIELLTDELVNCDYADNPQWHELLKCICSTQKYPAVMKSFLLRGDSAWYRLWIAFIRLLKHQITQSVSAVGTPINSMLPVVEAAFKLDVENRCRAFECWNVLIDSFSTETNENNITKRIKLLLIPLKSNNAKAEATALAKFRCWWHLIIKFRNKMEKFLDTVLVSFLHFCFGKHDMVTALVPGQIFTAVKEQCLQAIVDVVGHVNCDGCTNLPKLHGKLLNTKHLVDNWSHWIFSLTSVIVTTVNNDYGLTKQQMTCLWKSFLMTIGELPENNIRKDLFSEILSIMEHLAQECKSNNRLKDFMFDVLVLSLFDKDMRIKHLLKTKTDVKDPLYTIIKVVLDPSLNVLNQSCDVRDMITKLKPITDAIFDPTVTAPNSFVRCLLQTFAATDEFLILWIALAKAICELEIEIYITSVCSILLWPLKSIKKFTDIKVAAMTWYTTYDLLYQKLNQTDIDKDISKYLFSTKDLTISTIYFKICITLSVIKHKITDGSYEGCEKEIELLQNLTNNIDSYQNFKQLFPILVDRVLVILNTLISSINESVMQHALVCVKNMFSLMNRAYNEQSDESNLLYLTGSLLKPLDSLFKIESYSKLIPIIIDDLLECSSFLSNESSTKSTILSVMKTFSLKIVETDVTYNKIKAIIDKIESEQNELEKVENSITNNFTTPKTKEVLKRIRKKEANIVNTVVENGEEYVVVKSNWKFNPRKLTENQKEKLQRKREDIPALYQDLSQSQDEFKLATWKTDSQDTSNSSKSDSKSCRLESNETATEILKKIPSSNVVPKILETFFSENGKKDCTSSLQDTVSKDKVKNKEPSTPKNTKSPRMALKDRVFRNVRNLIEKSGVQKENKDASEDLNKTEIIVKTPTLSTGIDAVNMVNSAPSLLSADRPSRVKRKPKKFDELQLTAKKSRKSLQNYESEQSRIATTPSNTTTEDANIMKDDAPVICGTANRMINNANDLQASEKQDIAKVDEVTQNNENVQKIEETKNIIIEEHEKQNSEKSLLKNHENSNISNDEENNDKIDEQSKDNENDTSNASNDNRSHYKTNVHPSTTNDEQSIKENNQLPDTNSDEQPIDNNEQFNDKKDENSNEKRSSPGSKDKIEVLSSQTPKSKGTEESKSTTKKYSAKKSRIEKELAIDTVEGHPFLKMQTQKRMTRKALESAGTSRRKSLAEKFNKSKSEVNGSIKSDKKIKEKNIDDVSANTSLTVDDSQEKCFETKDDSSFSEELLNSEDVIESSQDSTITTISVKSAKKTANKVPVVSLEKIKLVVDNVEDINESQSILDCVIVSPAQSSSRSIANQGNKDDSELPLNNTVLEEKSRSELTENMDTEPINETQLSDVVIVLNDEDPAPLTLSSDETIAGPETQEIAEADTQPTDPDVFMDTDVTNNDPIKPVSIAENIHEICAVQETGETLSIEISPNKKPVNPLDNTTATLLESGSTELDEENENGASSPSSFRDENQRKRDFLNNTLEISPIKNMSPDRDKKSPSPETSSDYVVIKLTSPVHSNGEPYEKCASPEVFTEEKISPDKRDQSPPRVEISVANTSPSSSLSLKKNRPQVRSGGRAAQMLGLCVPDKVQAIVNPEKTETEEIIKNNNTSNTPVRRNLRMLYNQCINTSLSANENAETTRESEDNENFLKFRKSLPTVNSSPSGPILKRKLVEIVDDATISPASKRKRVSFHDPPVSTTISVQKYIEPGGMRSPQNSAQKRLERQMRQYLPIKSPKRLDHAFKLDTVLTKTIESFSTTTEQEPEVISTPDDTQAFSLDVTPVVEIVRASELNDTDPICPELINCEDPIDNIASELSSSAMKMLLVKELEGKIATVGDLAKMTELEVNRLCIKAPKVNVAKKVLSDYTLKRVDKPQIDVMVTIDKVAFNDPVTLTDLEPKRVDVESQTQIYATSEMEVQTIETSTTVTCVQTDSIPIAHTSIQTDESGRKSTSDIITSCLAERPDFVEKISEHLEESAIQQIANHLPFTAMTDVLMKKVSPSNCTTVLNRILDEQCNNSSDDNCGSKQLSFIQDYVCNRFEPKDLVMFCSEVLKAVYHKPAQS